MIKSKRKILGTEFSEAVSKTIMFSTNFKGSCEINIKDFMSQESRDAGLDNGVLYKVPITKSDELNEKLDQINALVYEILMLQEEFEDGEKC